MSKRNLFISFAESDGGHSYLAARAMLNANSIGHLIFRTTVSDALDAVVAGQANYAVVPFYNSITQWEGPTVKALASGQFEIFAQVCMPTSYVMAAHSEYMAEIVERYQALSDREEKLSPERAKKIYTRFLTRIFVGSQAEEQYRGRLQRPDMAQATIEHAKNPLRVLEEIARNELIKELKTGTSRRNRQNTESYGNSQIMVDIPTKPATISELNVPAALIAAGLLDMPQESDGWDKHGSVGELVSLLRNLLELLDVYSFGAPDLPENKTQYVLLGRRLAGAPPQEALRLPGTTPPKRIMTMVRSNYKKSSTAQWMKPREALSTTLKDFGYILDRAPIMVATGATRTFLMEGGRAKGQTAPSTAGSSTLWGGGSRKTLREKIEYRADPKPPSGSIDDVYKFYLGEYQTWCPAGGDHCWCCDEAADDSKTMFDIFAWLSKNWQTVVVGTLISAALLLFVYLFYYCTLTGACAPDTGPTYDPSRPTDSSAPPPAPDPAGPTPTNSGPASSPPSAVNPTSPANSPAANQPPHTGYPPVDEPNSTKPSNQSTYPGYTGYPGYNVDPSKVGSTDKPEPAEKPPVTKPAPPAVAPAKPDRSASTPALPPARMLHVPFFAQKANLLPDAVNTLNEAATQSLTMNKQVNLRVFSNAPAAETDQALWNRRLNAVKDELVRLGVPVQRIIVNGTGPYVLTVRNSDPLKPVTPRQRTSYDLDEVDEPFAVN